MIGRFSENRIVLFKVAIIVFVLYRVFSLDIFPAALNDSVNYLNGTVSGEFTKDPGKIIQIRGYRHAAGYPLYLSVWYGLADLVSLDGLQLMALSQRVLLAVSLVGLVWVLGPITLPLALYFSSGHFLAQTNILYAEGMTLPFSIILGLTMVKLYEMRNKEKVSGSRRYWLLMALLTITYFLLVLAKINSIVFGLPLLALALNIGRDGFRPKISLSRIWLPISLILLLVFCFVLVVSFDNYETFGEFTPIYAKERFYFWGAWQQIFGEHPENGARPELAQYYGGGSPYTFLHGVEDKAGGYEEFLVTLPIIRKGTAEMMAQSELPVFRERLRTFGYGLLGGGKQELQSTRKKILAANSSTTNDLQFWSGNGFVKAYGYDEFLNKYNRGEESSIIRGLKKSPIVINNSYRFFQAYLTVLVILGLVVLLGWRKIGLTSIHALSFFAYIAMIAITAISFIDIWRYIVPAWAFFMVTTFHGFLKPLEETKLGRYFSI